MDKYNNKTGLKLNSFNTSEFKKFKSGLRKWQDNNKRFAETLKNTFKKK